MSLTFAGTADLKQPKVKSQSTLAMKLLSFVHKQRQAVQEDETEPKDASSTSSTTVTDESYRRSLLITVPVGEVPERYFKNSTGSELSPEELMQLSVLVHPALAEQNISLLDALQSGLLIPKGPVTDANLVTPDSGYGPGSDTGSNERPLSEERPASRDGRAKEDRECRGHKQPEMNNHTNAGFGGFFSGQRRTVQYQSLERIG